MSRTVDAAVLAEWLERKLGSLGLHHDNPKAVLAATLEVSTKRLWQLRSQRTANGAKTTSQPRDEVEDALHKAGVFMWEVYPTDDNRDVVSPTTSGQRRSLDRIIRGQPAGVYGKLTDQQMYALHELHTERGVSVRELGRMIWRPSGFKTEHSATQSIIARWEALELPRRSQAEASLRANTKHGLRRDRGKTPEAREFRRKQRLATGEIQAKRCAGVNNRGKACQRWAKPGSDYCYAHQLTKASS